MKTRFEVRIYLTGQLVTPLRASGGETRNVAITRAQKIGRVGYVQHGRDGRAVVYPAHRIAQVEVIPSEAER